MDFEILLSAMICNIVQYIIICINLNANSPKFMTPDSFMNVLGNCMFVITIVIKFVTSKPYKKVIYLIRESQITP